MAAAKKTAPALTADQVTVAGKTVTVIGSLGRSLSGFEQLRDAQQAWNLEQGKSNETQDLGVLYRLLTVVVGEDHADAVNGLSVIEALRLWQASTVALDAVDAALLAELGVTPGESEAPTNS